MAKSKKLGRCEFKHNGYKVMPIFDGSKPTGKYGVVAGKNLVSEPMSLKDAIETLKSDNFTPKKKIKR
jgi:hypothetical protein